MKKLTLALLTSCLTIAHAQAMFQAGRPLNRIAHRSLAKQLNRKFSTEASKPTDSEDLKKIIKLLEEKNKMDEQESQLIANVSRGYLVGTALAIGCIGYIERDTIKSKIKNLFQND